MTTPNLDAAQLNNFSKRFKSRVHDRVIKVAPPYLYYYITPSTCYNCYWAEINGIKYYVAQSTDQKVLAAIHNNTLDIKSISSITTALQYLTYRAYYNRQQNCSQDWYVAFYDPILRSFVDIRYYNTYSNF